MADGSRAPEVFGIGVAVRDVVLTLEGFPPIDGKVAAQSILETTGGPVPNALVTLSHLGRSCAFAGLVGADDAGQHIREELLRAGIDACQLVELAELDTPTSVILVAGATRTVIECGQDALPCTAHLADAWALSAAESSAFLADGRLPEAQERVACSLRERGGRVVLDGGSPRAGLEALIPHADVAVFSSSYAQKQGVDSEDMRGMTEFVRALAEETAPEGLGIAGLTLGQEGSLLATRDGRVLRHAPPEIDVVDSTGAGDVFHGALLDALLDGADLGSAARFANAAATLSCRGATGRAPLPARDEIVRFAGQVRGAERS